MPQTLDELYSSLSASYKKDTDQDFPTNKIRFFMDFLWNSLLAKPLTEEQKTSLKSLIDLLNALDDHKLSPTREMITNLTPQLSPLITTYPSLGHTFTFVTTTLIPAYQRYLTSLEGQVKLAHPFTKEEVLLYYDMTLVDHAILSHLFETESTLNLVEVITSIKSVIVTNALTHDFLQDALNRSISLFTFLQRGGLAKEKCHEYYLSLVDQVLATQKATVTNETTNSAVEYICKKLVELSTTATTAAAAQATETAPAPATDPAPVTLPLPESTALPTVPTIPLAPEPIIPAESPAIESSPTPVTVVPQATPSEPVPVLPPTQS